MANTTIADRKNSKAYIITGPTSGIGKVTAFELAKHGTVVLVGRSKEKLDAVQQTIIQNGGKAVSVVCDLSDVANSRRAAAEIVGLKLPIAGLLNNAGISPTKTAKTAQGWDITFATNYLGPFAFTEALVPHLADGTNVVFIASAVEDPERKPVKALGMKGGRFISVAASAKGEWKPGGTKLPGADAYATSKQCVLAAAFAMARETPRLNFNAVEPGITPGTGLGRDTNAFFRFLFGSVVILFPPFSHFRSTPQKAAGVITNILTQPGATGIYYDENSQPMHGSEQVSNQTFQDQVVAETRVFLKENY